MSRLWSKMPRVIRTAMILFSMLLTLISIAVSPRVFATPGGLCVRLNGVILPETRRRVSLLWDVQHNTYTDAPFSYEVQWSSEVSPDRTHLARMWIAFINHQNSSSNNRMSIEPINADAVYPARAQSVIYSAHWSPDSQYLAYSDQSVWLHPSLRIMSLDGSIRDAPLKNLPQNFSWSSDSQFIMVNQGFGLTVIELRTLAETSYQFPNGMGYMKWSPQGHKIALVTGNPNSNYMLNTLVAGQTPKSLTIPPLLNFAWSADGQHLALLAGAMNRFTLSLYDDTTQQISPVSDISPTAGAIYPVVDWSPDSKTLYYTRPDSGDLDAYHLEARASEVLLSGFNGFFYPTLDKNYLIIIDHKPRSISVRALRLRDGQITAGAETRVLLSDSYMLPDNVTLAYIAEQQGSYSVHRLNILSGADQTLTDGLYSLIYFGNNGPRRADIEFWWKDANGKSGYDGYSADGQRLFRFAFDLTNVALSGQHVYISPDHQWAIFLFSNQVIQMAAADGTTARVLPLPRAANITWSPDSSMFLLAQNGPSGRPPRSGEIQILDTQGKQLMDYQGQAFNLNSDWVHCA